MSKKFLSFSLFCWLCCYRRNEQEFRLSLSLSLSLTHTHNHTVKDRRGIVRALGDVYEIIRTHRKKERKRFGACFFFLVAACKAFCHSLFLSILLCLSLSSLFWANKKRKGIVRFDTHSIFPKGKSLLFLPFPIFCHYGIFNTADKMRKRLSEKITIILSTMVG